MIVFHKFSYINIQFFLPFLLCKGSNFEIIYCQFIVYTLYIDTHTHTHTHTHTQIYIYILTSHFFTFCRHLSLFREIATKPKNNSISSKKMALKIIKSTFKFLNFFIKKKMSARQTNLRNN